MEATTLNQIINRLREIADNSPVIKSFQWDELPEIETGEQMPFVYVFEDGAIQNGSVFNLNLKLLFMDLVNKSSDNKFETSSDMLELAKRFVAELRKPNDIFILDETNLTYTAFYDEKFDNEAHGWGVDLTLKIAMLYDTCEAAIPDAPVVSLVDFDTASISINWSAVSGATSYHIDVARDAAFTDLVVDNADVGNITTYTIEDLDNTTLYYIRLRAYNNYVVSNNSNVISIGTNNYYSQQFLARTNPDYYDIDKLNTWFKKLILSPAGDLRDSVLVDNIFHVTGYRQNNTTVSKKFSTPASGMGDLLQSTATRQPLLLPYTGERYYASRATLTPNFLRSSLNYMPANAAGIEFIFSFRIFNGGGAYQSVISLNNDLGGTNVNTLTWYCNGNDLYVDSGVAQKVGGGYIQLSDTVQWLGDIPYGQRLWLKTLLLFDRVEHYISTDGINYGSPVHTYFQTYAGESFVCKPGISNFSFNNSVPQAANSFSLLNGDVFYFHAKDLATDTLVSNLNLANHNPANESWTGVAGETWTMQRVPTGYPPAVVDRDKQVYDGADDKMQSGSFIASKGKVTTYIVGDFNSLASGRYIVDDFNERFRIYYDGTNILAGDSSNQLNIGTKPTGIKLLTWIKNGANSFAQFNQNAGVTGNSGNVMPTDIIIGGRKTDGANAATYIGAIIMFDGEHDEATRTYIQNTLNELFDNTLF